MRRFLGRIGGMAAALALAVPSHVPAQTAVSMATAEFVQFESPAGRIVEAGDAPVALVSCLGEGGCATDACHAPACETYASCDPCGGCNACGSCNAACCGCGDGLLGACGGWMEHLSGLVQPSERCFNEFLSPMTNPVYFEDPRTLTEARLIYIHHKVPLTAAGGDINLVALQLRAALTERLSIIATKDGYLTSTNPLIDDGWADINLGLKYNLLRNPRRQMLYSVGATYTLPVGSTRSQQGNGDGSFHLFSTFGKRIYGWNWLIGKGIIIPTDGDAESEWMYVSNHLSHRLGESNLFFLAEANWYNWLESGANGIPGVEGGDLFNFGSTSVSGNDIVTGAFGLKYKPSNLLEVGLAWENPLTKRRDVLDNRITFDLIVRY